MSDPKRPTSLSSIYATLLAPDWESMGVRCRFAPPTLPLIATAMLLGLTSGCVDGSTDLTASHAIRVVTAKSTNTHFEDIRVLQNGQSITVSGSLIHRQKPPSAFQEHVDLFVTDENGEFLFTGTIPYRDTSLFSNKLRFSVSFDIPATRIYLVGLAHDAKTPGTHIKLPASLSLSK